MADCDRSDPRLCTAGEQMRSFNPRTRLYQNISLRTSFWNTIFKAFPEASDLYPVVPNSRVFGTPRPFEGGGTSSPEGNAPSKSGRKTEGEMGRQEPA
jgi:hypothetical protein